MSSNPGSSTNPAKDWVREAAAAKRLRLPDAQPAQQPVAQQPAESGWMDQMMAAQAQMMQLQMQQQSMRTFTSEARLQQLRLEAEEAELIRRRDGLPTNGHAPVAPAAEPMVNTLVQGMMKQQEALLSRLDTLSQNAVTSEQQHLIEGLKTELSGLRTYIQDAARLPQQQAPPMDPLTALTSGFQKLREVKEAITTFDPPPPPAVAPAGASELDMLNADIARLDRQIQYEQVVSKREELIAKQNTSIERANILANGLKEAGGRVVEALTANPALAERLGGLLGGGNGHAAAAQHPVPPAVGPPQPPDLHSSLMSFPCPICSATVNALPSQMSVTCSQCGTLLNRAS